MPNASPPAPLLRIGTWNTEFAEPGRVRGERVRPILAAPDCDILCVTEGYAEIFPDGGNIVTGGDDPEYPIVEGQKKVLLWSKEPWKSVEFGPEEMLTQRICPLSTPRPAEQPREASASSLGELPTNPCQTTSEYGRTSRPREVGRSSVRASDLSVPPIVPATR